MQKCLYLLCPTDCLETVINNTFRREHYFYTSLGNSVVFNNDSIKEIKTVINKHRIDELCFVLSNNNHFVLDALANNDYSNIKGLNSLYKEIKIKKKHSNSFWETDYNHFSIFSYYLNSKIQELQRELGSLLNKRVKIKAKIYDRNQHKFKNVYSNLLCIEAYHLN